MAAIYEVDRPARRSVFHFLGMMIVGAAGVAAALVTDFVAKGDASAILKMNVILNQLAPWEVPLGYLTLALLVAGPMAVLVFEPRTKRAAFYTGASVLAVAMAGTPVEELERMAPLFDFNPPALQGMVSPAMPTLPETMLDPQANPDETSFLSGNGDGRGEFNMAMETGTLELATYTPCVDEQTPVVAAGFSFASMMTSECFNDRTIVPAQMNTSVAVTVSVLLPDDSEPPKMSARLYDSVSDQTWDLGVGRASRKNGGYLVTYTANVAPNTTSGKPLAHLYVRVEAEGYEIAETDQQLSNVAPVVLGLQLANSSQPIWMQRFSRPYKF